MLNKISSKRQIGAACGILAPIVAFVCITSAIALYPEFNWLDNALSDLGVVSGVTGPLFNLGLVLSGIFAFIFSALGLSNYIGERWLGKIGVITFTAGTLALTAIGLFPENVTPTHYIVSVLFFVLIPIALFIITGAFALKHQKNMAYLTLLTAIIGALPWILYFIIEYAPKVAIPEAISGVTFSVWALVLGAKTLKGN